MTEKFKILAKYIKDISSETPDIETFFFVKENIEQRHRNFFPDYCYPPHSPLYFSPITDRVSNHCNNEPS